jgi:hypothetical protein
LAPLSRWYIYDMGSFYKCLTWFHKKLNTCHPTIKFTYNISKKNVSFLDVKILKNENCTLSTEIHIKPTDKSYRCPSISGV